MCRISAYSELYVQTNVQLTCTWNDWIDPGKAMNRFFLRTAPAVLFLGATGVLRAEDWTARDGVHYENVVVLKVEADAVTILDRDGGGLIPLSNLPPDLQKRFGYDPVKARAAADARAKASAQNDQRLKQEAQAVAEKRKQEEAAEKAGKKAALAKTSSDPDYFSGIGQHLGNSNDGRTHYQMPDVYSKDKDTSNHGPP
jgi:hypothetical protein